MSMQSIVIRLRAYFNIHPASAFLLGAQMLLLLLYAFFDTGHRGQALLSVSGLVVVVLVVWLVIHSPAKKWVAWMLAVPTVVLLVMALFGGPVWLAWASIFEALLYFYAAASLIAYMMGDTRVTLDELWAAGATFTLLAWAFGYLYFACEVFLPGSFLSTIAPNGQRTFLELLSLVFTNLTATGLSDILPGTSAARVLIMLTQFVGIGYVALVVSRLIAMTITRRQRRKEYDSRPER